MWGSVMKFEDAWTFAGQPRGGTPTPPPGKRTPVLPRRLTACLALFRQTGRCVFRAMLAVFRTSLRQHLAFGEHVLGPCVPHLAAQPKRHYRRLSDPPPSHKACLGNMCIGQRLSHSTRRLSCSGRIGPPRPNRLASACRGTSEIGSVFSNGRFPDPSLPWNRAPSVAFGPPSGTQRRAACFLRNSSGYAGTIRPFLISPQVTTLAGIAS